VLLLKALHAYSREVYVALRSMGDLDRTLELWTQVRSENSYPILVATDEVLKLLISEGLSFYSKYIELFSLKIRLLLFLAVIDFI